LPEAPRVAHEGLAPAVLSAHERGLVVIPLRDDEKRPAVRWKPYQSVRPTLDELRGWHEQLAPRRWAIVTGEVSGVVALDFDGPEGRALCERLGSRLT